jgi:hypothetical protein
MIIILLYNKLTGQNLSLRQNFFMMSHCLFKFRRHLMIEIGGFFPTGLNSEWSQRYLFKWSEAGLFNKSPC